MKQPEILLGFLQKNLTVMQKLYEELIGLDINLYDKRYVFSLKTQQLYSSIEDLLKQIAKSFENHIDDLSQYHKEILIRMNTEIPQVRPKVLSDTSYLFLDKLRSFRHFIRHAYDCELDPEDLKKIQERLREGFSHLVDDIKHFETFVKRL
jgi:hypothetical protein